MAPKNKKEINIWESFNFDEVNDSSCGTVREKLNKIGDDLSDTTSGILTKDITQTGDYVDFCFTLTARSEDLGNYGKKVFSVAYESEKEHFSIWNHQGGETITFDDIEELDSKIEEVMDDKVIRNIQDLYSQANERRNE